MSNTGYLHSAYAESFREIGEPLCLQQSGGSLIKRLIPGTEYFDAMGCYPLFLCSNWAGLEQDMADLSEDLISITVVTDPFGEYDEALLRRCFPDLARPYKTHFVADLSKPLEQIVSTHHQRNVRKARNQCDVERCTNHASYLEDWIGLYGNLVDRHDIQGIPAFSHETFEAQFKTPGLVAFRAFDGAQTLGMLLWFVQGNVGHYHLGAYSDVGYNRRVSFALFWKAFEYFSEQGLVWASMGAGAGIIGDTKDGLSRFKQGWSTEERTAYLCGRIINVGEYESLSGRMRKNATDYFPAYRNTG